MPSRSSASKPAARRFLIPEPTAKVREASAKAASTRAAVDTSKRSRSVNCARVLRIVPKASCPDFSEICSGGVTKPRTRDKTQAPMAETSLLDHRRPGSTLPGEGSLFKPWPKWNPIFEICAYRSDYPRSSEIPSSQPTRSRGREQRGKPSRKVEWTSPL